MALLAEEVVEAGALVLEALEEVAWVEDSVVFAAEELVDGAAEEAELLVEGAAELEEKLLEEEEELLEEDLDLAAASTSWPCSLQALSKAFLAESASPLGQVWSKHCSMSSPLAEQMHFKSFKPEHSEFFSILETQANKQAGGVASTEEAEIAKAAIVENFMVLLEKGSVWGKLGVFQFFCVFDLCRARLIISKNKHLPARESAV